MPAAAVRRGSTSRRDLLIDSALDVIAAHGVAGTTHRRVAAAAGVPLGSTTYYFADLGDLLGAAFDRFADQISERFESRLSPARSPEEAITAITDFMLYDFDDPRELALSYELYAWRSVDPRSPAWSRPGSPGVNRPWRPSSIRSRRA